MKYIIDIHGEIEGDYEILGKYEERPQGKWVQDDWNKIIECNLCHGQAPVCVTSAEQYQSKFCPTCGAKMKGGAE